jgi:PAS domain S-box-containing protein
LKNVVEDATRSDMNNDLFEDLALSIIDFANLPITLIGTDYRYRLVNNSFCLVHDKEKHELVGQSVVDVWGGEVFETAIKRNLDLCFTGRPVRDEAWMNLPARGRRYCEVVYSPYFDGPKSVSHAVVITYDITERKDVEEALLESEQRFRKLSEASLEAIVFTQDGIVVDANSAMSHLFGCEGNEILGRPATDFVVYEERAVVAEKMRARGEGTYETMGLRKDGTLFPIEVKARHFTVEGYDVSIFAVRDLTERKKVERQLRTYQEHLERLVEERTQELRKSEEKFRNIFLNATEGIFQVTPEGRILSTNPAFATILGYESGEELAREVDNMGMLHADPQKRKEYMQLVHSEPRISNFECLVCRKDETKTWVSVNARAVRDERGGIVYHEGTVQDINERKRMEEQVLLQRDLALSLAATLSMDNALTLCLDAAMKTSGAGCGAIHVRNRETDDLEMTVHVGLSEGFAKRFSSIRAGSKIWSMSLDNRQMRLSISNDLKEPLRSHLLREGINSLAIVPVFYNEEMTAAMNLGFSGTQTVNAGWPTLQLIASQLGNIMVRIEIQQELKNDIEKRTKAEEALQAKSRSLEEMNTALKVLLNQREMDKSELEESVLDNVRQLILPYTHKLRESRLGELQTSLVDVVEENLNRIISPFLKRVRVFNFTPKELEVVTLIKEGKTTKDIAAILKVGTAAIDLHRYNIRKKLGINQAGTNLRSYLLSLE